MEQLFAPLLDPYMEPGMPQEARNEQVDEQQRHNFECNYCPRSFTSATGLRNHTRAAHAKFCPYTLRLRTNFCPICNSNLGTRGKTLKHLKERAVCGIKFLDTVQPMSEIEFKGMVHKLNTTNTVLTRSQAPRRGPIGKGQSQPLAAMTIQQAAALSSEEHLGRGPVEAE
eukprot:6264470-Amphidinium_carterae.1